MVKGGVSDGLDDQAPINKHGDPQKPVETHGDF